MANHLIFNAINLFISLILSNFMIDYLHKLSENHA